LTLRPSSDLDMKCTQELNGQVPVCMLFYFLKVPHTAHANNDRISFNIPNRANNFST